MLKYIISLPLYPQAKKGITLCLGPPVRAQPKAVWGLAGWVTIIENAFLDVTMQTSFEWIFTLSLPLAVQFAALGTTDYVYSGGKTINVVNTLERFAEWAHWAQAQGVGGPLSLKFKVTAPSSQWKVNQRHAKHLERDSMDERLQKLKITVERWKSTTWCRRKDHKEAKQPVRCAVRPQRDAKTGHKPTTDVIKQLQQDSRWQRMFGRDTMKIQRSETSLGGNLPGSHWNVMQEVVQALWSYATIS